MKVYSCLLCVEIFRSLNQVQSRSQACLPLLNGSTDDEERRRERDHRHNDVMSGNPLNNCQFDGSREKLYGLKSLSKSQGMLNIYRSLESLQKQKRDLLRQKERSKTEDALPFLRHYHQRRLAHGFSSASLGSATSCSRDLQSSTTTSDVSSLSVEDGEKINKDPPENVDTDQVEVRNCFFN